jgi:hypothetical protein
MKLKLNTKLRYSLYLVLACVFLSLTSCDDGYPYHSVFEGKQRLIVHKVEKIDDAKYDTWKYAITDATGKDWTLKSFQQFQVGDTLRISNAR